MIFWRIFSQHPNCGGLICSNRLAMTQIWTLLPKVGWKKQIPIKKDLWNGGRGVGKANGLVFRYPSFKLSCDSNKFYTWKKIKGKDEFKGISISCFQFYAFNGWVSWEEAVWWLEQRIWPQSGIWGDIAIPAKGWEVLREKNAAKFGPNLGHTSSCGLIFPAFVGAI